MSRREQSRDDDATDAQQVSKDELRNARIRSGMTGVRPWGRKRQRMGVAQFVTAKSKAEWLARERRKAEQIELTPEEIAEDERYRR